MSNMKYLQRYMTSYELEYRRFERQPQINQLYLTFTPKMEERFETLDTADIDMNPYHSIIEPIVNRNFGNTLQISVNTPTKTPVNSTNT